VFPFVGTGFVVVVQPRRPAGTADFALQSATRHGWYKNMPAKSKEAQEEEGGEPFPPRAKGSALLAEIRRAVPRLNLVPRRGGAAPGGLRPALVAELKGLPPEALLGAPVADASLAEAVRAGLLLRADLLEESHEVSQGLSTREGSYWHGIMHRREPDYANAKYWFRRVGDHPLFDTLAAATAPAAASAALAAATTRGRWDPFRFIDLCEACEEGARRELREGLELLQDRELTMLLEFCARGALGAERPPS
jgi:hypothetical protein